MSLINKNQKLVERKEGVPKFDKRNATDRKIAFWVILSLFILAILITVALLAYFLPRLL